MDTFYRYTPSKKNHTAAVAGGVLGVVVLVILALLLFFYRRRRARDRERSGPSVLTSPILPTHQGATIHDEETSKEQYIPTLPIPDRGGNHRVPRPRTNLHRDAGVQPNPSMPQPAPASPPRDPPLPPATQALDEIGPRTSTHSNAEIIQRLLDRGLSDSAITVALNLLSAEASGSGPRAGATPIAPQTSTVPPPPRVMSPGRDVSAAPPEYDFKSNNA